MSLLLPILDSLRRQFSKVIAREAEHELTAGQVLQACQEAARIYGTAVSGQRVGILLPNSALAPIAILGAMWAGKVPVPLNPQLKPTELALILEETAIDTFVVSTATAPLVAGLSVKAVRADAFLQSNPTVGPPPVTAAASDIAVLLYTSGTTGHPKGVPLTHDNLLSNARGVITRLDGRADDVCLAVLPLFHAFGLIETLAAWLAGAEVIYTQFTPERVATLSTQHKATVLLGVPSVFRLLVRSKVAGSALQSLRRVMCGGDALPPSVRDGYRQRFAQELLEGYGLTETSPVICVNTPEHNKPGSVGQALPGVEVRIEGEEGSLQPVGRAGEIQVRGPNVMAGYFNRPEENRQALTADSWLRTGDLGYIDAEGYLTVTGRIKELIIRDGEKIMPREVEDVLTSHPTVFDAAVVGVPDGARGEAVVAFVAPAGQPATAEELRAFCRARLAEFKVPRRFVIATDLPRGPTGKILKRALKDRG